MSRGIRAVLFTGCATLVLCAPALAQVVEPMGTFVPPRQRRMQASEGRTLQPAPSATSPTPAAPPPQAPVSANSATPPSLLDKPAEPAKVDLASGRLTIHADNSSLVEIINKLKTDSGMTVDGLGSDQRIFGSYGPGDPQEVLSALLDGSGYNVVMVGRTETGTPRQLSLTPRGAGVSRGGPGGRQQPVAQDEDNDDEAQQQPQPASELPSPPQQPPQQGNPQQNGVRTPQQMLQELQQMRQQQMQQQQQQGVPPPQQP